MHLFCENDAGCSAFAADGQPAFSDGHHLNADFASSLATVLQSLPKSLAADEPPTSGQ